MKYYIYLSHASYINGDYILEIFKDDNYKNKWDFYKKCIANRYDDNPFEKFSDYENCQRDEIIMILCVDIVVDNKIRAYYIDAYENLDNAASRYAVEKSHYLGIVPEFINAETNETKYAQTFGNLLSKKKIVRHDCGFIIMASLDDCIVNNIDFEHIDLNLSDNKINNKINIINTHNKIKKYYIYLENTTYCSHGEYILDIYPDNNYKNKWDFYKKCIIKRNSTPRFKKFSDYLANINNGDGDVTILCIEIEVSNKITAYYVDAYENHTTTASKIAVSTSHYLGTVAKFIDAETEKTEYENFFTDKFRQNKIKMHCCGFIIMVNNNQSIINNIDQENIKINYNLTNQQLYFKITNTNENHHGFQYVDGLNVLDEPFDEFSIGVPNGFYYTNALNIFEYLDLGIYLRQVIPAQNENNFKSQSMGDSKWRANKIILGKRYILADISTFKYLIKLGANIYASNNNALRWAVKHGYLDIVKYLIKCFKHNNLTCNLYNTLTVSDNIQIIDNEAVRNACRYGHLAVAKYLIKYGADIHADDNDALVGACDNNQLDVVKYLISIGANIQSTNDLAIVGASGAGNYDIVTLLIQNGANLKNNDCLIVASQYGHLNIVKLLLKRNVDIHLYNDCAFRLACENGHLDTVKCLVKNGANIHALNDEAIDKATDNNHTSIVQYLTSIDKKN